VRAMDAPDGLPVVGVRHVDAGTDDVGQATARLVQRALDLAQDVVRLRGGIAGPDDVPRVVGCRRSGNVDEGANPHGARVADDPFPDGPGRYVLAFRDHGGSPPGAKCESDAEMLAGEGARREAGAALSRAMMRAHRHTSWG